MRKRPLILVAVIAACFKFAPLADAKDWEATPITVHEWGVEVFDWSNGKPVTPVLPTFIHTDKNPGMPQPAPINRVKDLQPDPGYRFKPVLHFYLPAQTSGETVVGVELRFSAGHANAWYPQANIYRTPVMTANAKGPDLQAWQKSPLVHRTTATQPGTPVPDDPRMELAWQRLTLSKNLPAAMHLEEDLPKDHWIRTAREVPSAYISNGNESERFLFYEGATHETPAIAIVRDEDFMGIGPTPFHVMNVSTRPIYNVFAIYRHDGHAWLSYSSGLDPIPAKIGIPGSAGTALASLPLPNFDTLTAWSDEKSLKSLTSDRLISGLTEGGTFVINHSARDPAYPQGPTQSATLTPEEAAAVEKIWHDDFFNSEGLTILYRESPAALDEAMPLNLYTDMYHYIQLSRCGLVVNKNIDIKAATTAFNTTPAAFEKLDPEARAQAIAQMKANRMFLEGSIAFDERTGRTYEVTRLRQLEQLIEKP